MPSSLVMLAVLLSSSDPTHPEASDGGSGGASHELERTRCRVNNVALSIVVESHGDEPAADDTSVWIEHGSDRHRVPFARPARLVLERGEVTSRGVFSACDDTVALAHPTGRLLVLLARDARPQGNELAGFVYNTRNGQVTEVFLGLCPYGRVLRTEVWKDALLVGSVRTLDPPFGQHPEGCPAQCPRVAGSQVLRLGAEELTVTWRLSLSGGFKRVIDVDKTRIDAGLGRAFGGRAPFAQVAGIAPDRSKIERTFKATAELEDGRRCFALLATQRMPTEAEWSCR